MAAEKLRDLSQPIDVALLDATVAAFYGTGSKDERTAADHILRDLQNNPDMWLQVVHILSNTQSLNTKFFSLQVLEGVIKYRWNVLPVEQRDGMKNYISDVIVKILKHEWPARWRNFIPDLVAAAKTSETICENCMAILKLLSEEVFDFSRGEMTQQKIKELKQSLNSEFQLIHAYMYYQHLKGPPHFFVSTPAFVQRSLSSGGLQAKSVHDSLSVLILDLMRQIFFLHMGMKRILKISKLTFLNFVSAFSCRRLPQAFNKLRSIAAKQYHLTLDKKV